MICNKTLISTLNVTFATSFMSWHLLVTYCSLHVTIMGFGILNGISIRVLNMTLGFNSLGFELLRLLKQGRVSCISIHYRCLMRVNFHSKCFI
ncbi:hypothetical protein CFOL_v3_28486 [Cephalotus follicularis]|uniref:Uncharacterized protein n=1 Tax=Cephalotus follicularis TaxID=3775 RepID=A0A1Q3CXR9_CEPFO|nr:hypothetical protein CFOL_v3_28486 [Cephalotus follicularis]